LSSLHQSSGGSVPQGARSGEGGRLAVWCGWVFVGVAAITPLLAWLWPREFWVAPALAGLLCLPAARLRDEDRPVAMILFAGLIWAAVSTLWSPFHATKLDNSTILKLTLQLPLYGSAILAARRLDPVLKRRALHVLAWGCALFGLVLLAEGVTHGAAYKALRQVYGPMRYDLAEARIGHSTYLIAVIWPLAAYGGPKPFRLWMALAMFAGTGAAALTFGSDAPVLGLVLAPVTALIVWRIPNLGPKLLAAVAVLLFLTTPALVWAVRRYADYGAIQASLPETDSMRLGYWSHAIDWIGARPIRGWGLDASRMFGPGIKLHPHNNPLQVWMELGAIGGLLAATFWGVALTRLSRPAPSLAAASAAACAAVYLLFGVNFGVWQEWWLGLGALVAMLAVMNVPERTPESAAL
jgi:O-antigen ligase